MRMAAPQQPKPGSAQIGLMAVGSEIVAKSAADGYTLLLQGTQHAINLSLYKQLPFDTLRDFAPVAYIAAARQMQSRR